MAQGKEWSIHFSRVDSFSPGYTLFSVEGMAQDKEWSKHFSRADSFSLGYTSFSVGRMAQGGNGPGSEIRNNPSSLVEKNGADNPLLIFYIEGRHSFRYHRHE